MAEVLLFIQISECYHLAKLLTEKLWVELSQMRSIGELSSAVTPHCDKVPSSACASSSKSWHCTENQIDGGGGKENKCNDKDFHDCYEQKIENEC